MKQYLELLRNVEVLNEFENDDILKILNCLDVKIVTYSKNSTVLDECTFNQKIGIVVSGELQNIIVDYNGNQSIIATFTSGEMFAEALVCAEIKKPTICIIAVKDSDVMYLNYTKILTICQNTCSFHLKLIQNMLKVLSRKNIYLNQKINHLTKRTTKEKILTYLYDVSKQCEHSSFSIPYDRQGLANYLSVERTALSYELSKLKRDGIIEFKKNNFILLEK